MILNNDLLDSGKRKIKSQQLHIVPVEHSLENNGYLIEK